MTNVSGGGCGCKRVRVCVIRTNTPGEYFMCGAFIYFFISRAKVENHESKKYNIQYAHTAHGADIIWVR